MGIFSSLCNDIVDFGTNKSNPRGGTITKITPHHMAGFASAVDCAKGHLYGSRGASASAYIGSDGKICGGVSEDRRPWTSSSPENDYKAYTIEVANISGDPDWKISNAAYSSLVELCADVCMRYKINPHYDGTPNGTITIHKMFAATACPGPYLESLITSGKFENDIKALMAKNGIVQAHVQSLGWLPWQDWGETAGTTGQSRRLEAVRFAKDTEITAQCHVQSYGDLPSVPAGEICGTTGQSKRMESILLNAPYAIEYRVHVQGKGWLPWAKNGEWCGTKGESRRMEAIEVRKA